MKILPQLLLTDMVKGEVLGRGLDVGVAVAKEESFYALIVVEAFTCQKHARKMLESQSRLIKLHRTKEPFHPLQ